MRVPAALERSRSGRGGRVWLFFDDPLPAALVRRLGSHLLTEAMEGRPDIGRSKRLRSPGGRLTAHRSRHQPIEWLP
jgi:hypothetical protein